MGNLTVTQDPGGYLQSVLQTVNDTGIPHIWYVEFIPQQPAPSNSSTSPFYVQIPK